MGYLVQECRNNYKGVSYFGVPSQVKQNDQNNQKSKLVEVSILCERLHSVL